MHLFALWLICWSQWCRVPRLTGKFRQDSGKARGYQETTSTLGHVLSGPTHGNRLSGPCIAAQSGRH